MLQKIVEFKSRGTPSVLFVSCVKFRSYHWVEFAKRKVCLAPQQWKISVKPPKLLNQPHPRVLETAQVAVEDEPHLIHRTLAACAMAPVGVSHPSWTHADRKLFRIWKIQVNNAACR